MSIKPKGSKSSNVPLIGALACGWLALATAVFGQAGSLIWTNEFGDYAYDENTGAILANSRTVFVVGSVVDASWNYDWLVRALDSKTGAMLWQSQFGNSNQLEDANAIAIRGSRLFVVGYQDNAAYSASDWITCAYDTRSGVCLWTNRFANTNWFNAPVAVCVEGPRVFAVGEATSNFTVRACNANNGALLWQDTVPTVVGPDWATGIVAYRDAVYASGFTYDGGLHYDWLVRAYNGRTGRLLWQDKSNSAGLDDGPSAIAAGAEKVYAVGVVEDAQTNSDWLVKAYNAEDGHVVWQDRVDKGGGYDQASAVLVQGDRVYVAGISDVGGLGNPDDYHWLVRAYNGKNGSLLWEDSSRSIGGLQAPNSIGLSGTNLCVSGSTYQNGSDWLLRVYSARKGTLMWENEYDRSGYWDDECGMAVGSHSVYMLGMTTDAQTTLTDWMVRTYQLK